MAAKTKTMKTYLVYDPALALENGHEEIWLLDAASEAEAVDKFARSTLGEPFVYEDIDVLNVAVQEIGTPTYRVSRPTHAVVEKL